MQIYYLLQAALFHLLGYIVGMLLSRHGAGALVIGKHVGHFVASPCSIIAQCILVFFFGFAAVAGNNIGS
jgi:hypothetical protein